MFGVNRISTGDELWDWMQHLTHGQLNMGYGDGHVQGHNHRKLLLEKSERAWQRWNRDNQPHLDAHPG
jgi:prepilin-type processing-associated H-X9-DG protein